MRSMSWLAGGASGGIDPMVLEPRLRGMVKLLPELEDPVQLCETVYSMLESILRREGDRPLLTALSELVGEVISRIPFDAPADQIRRETRRSASICLKLLQTAYEKRAVGRDGLWEDGGRKERDLEYWLPPHLSHLLAPIVYTAPALPPPASGLPNAIDLCDAALSRRIDHVLTFFQRHNPSFPRPLPPIFLCSPEFAEKFKLAVAYLIYPAMRDTRQARILDSSFDPKTLDADGFWDHADDNLKSRLSTAWRFAWAKLRLPEDAPTDPAIGGPDLLALRKMLKPSSPNAYDLPEIGNRQLDLFVSLLDLDVDWWGQLSEKWKGLHHFYEQEKDPRIFQQQAREGVLRDELLRLFEELPEEWNDFLVLLCYRVFPRINIQFIETFVQNLGWNEAAREKRAPYLMRFLNQARARPDIIAAEQQQQAVWAEQTRQLRAYLKGFEGEGT